MSADHEKGLAGLVAHLRETDDWVVMGKAVAMGALSLAVVALRAWAMTAMWGMLVVPRGMEPIGILTGWAMVIVLNWSQTSRWRTETLAEHRDQLAEEDPRMVLIRTLLGDSPILSRLVDDKLRAELLHKVVVIRTDVRTRSMAYDRLYDVLTTTLGLWLVWFLTWMGA